MSAPTTHRKERSAILDVSPDEYLHYAELLLADPIFRTYAVTRFRAALGRFLAIRLGLTDREPTKDESAAGDAATYIEDYRLARAVAWWLANARFNRVLLMELSAEQVIAKLQHRAITQRDAAEQNKRALREVRRKRQAHRTHGGGLSRAGSLRALCVDCRRVNAHASGCTNRDDAIVFLPIGARVPRHGASKARWKEFARAMGGQIQTKLLARMPQTK